MSLSKKEIALNEAARILQVTIRKLRQLIRDGVIPARKVARRWIMDSADLAAYRDPIAQAMLHAPVARERLSRDDLRAIEEGRKDALSGNAKSFEEEIECQYDATCR